jgi:hypothetical protein
MRASLLFLTLALCCSIPVAAQLTDVLKKADDTLEHRDASGLPEEKIIAGLKEALSVGTANAISATGRHDGFLKNEAIRILLPPKLQPIGKGMRMLGMGEQVDDLEIGMNRAAEQATPLARSIFVTALKKMSFDDARRILTGGDSAATDYFQRTTSADLTSAFTPIVHHAMEKVGVVRQYNSVIKNAPGGAALANEFNLDEYVVGKTLDGIFIMLAEEERKIRKDPAARTTDLLKEVFARKQQN